MCERKVNAMNNNKTPEGNERKENTDRIIEIKNGKVVNETTFDHYIKA